MDYRIFGVIALGAALVIHGGRPVVAESFPKKPIILVVPTAPGGAMDLQARIFADAAGIKLGQSVVVSSGGGNAGIMSFRNAPPDGHTLLLMPVTTISKMVQYDTINDFQPITPLLRAPSFVVVAKDSPVSSMKELVELGKKKPDGLTYGSPGHSSPGHIIGAVFQEMTGVTMTHIPYRGSNPMITDLVGGRIDVGFSSFPNFRGQFEAGQIKMLAVAQEARWNGMPDVPSTSELGYKGMEVPNYFAIVGPKGIPLEILKKLNVAFVDASHDPQLERKIVEMGSVIITSSDPNDLTKTITELWDRVAPIAEKYGIK